MKFRLIIAICLIGSAGAACSDKKIGSKGFHDNFDRKELGKNYFDSIGRWVVFKNRLNIAHAYNHPLWLRRRLPRNVVIEFDATAYTRDGDIKVELFGDGKSYVDHRGAYRGTGYIVCFGGWNNTKSFIARRLEHPPRGRTREFMVSRTDRKVKVGQTYHFKITRSGNLVTWYLDGQNFLEYADRKPLQGAGHQYFAFNNWASEVSFDNLSIRPLK